MKDLSNLITGNFTPVKANLNRVFPESYLFCALLHSLPCCLSLRASLLLAFDGLNTCAPDRTLNYNDEKQNKVRTWHIYIIKVGT